MHPMDWRISQASLPAPKALVVALPLKSTHLPPGYRALDAATGGVLRAALTRPDLALTPGALTTLHPTRGAARLLLLGLGEPRDTRKQSTARTVEALRHGSAAVVRALRAARLGTVRFDLTPALHGALSEAQAGAAVGEGLGLGAFEFTSFHGSARVGGVKPRGNTELQVDIDAAMRPALREALRMSESVNLARGLAATPPNVANPAYLVAFCRKMASQVGLRCRVIDARQAARLHMGGLLAVGAAGSSPPALIILEWDGADAPRGRSSQRRSAPRRGAPDSAAPLLLVGKAVTFDTGGYSIKPAENMDRMKYDKCGGMAVIGAMHAIARLKLPRRVVGLIPTAENLISQRGYRPGDILTMHNGVTVEVTNTDAEGRLILADALAYGCRTYRPAAVVDLATLTGGVVVALGSACAGCFCHDAQLRSELFDAAEQTGERLWHLPLWDEHRQLIKGTHGDILNSAGREAHPIQGAAFLSHFIAKDSDFSRWSEQPWAHLDIAGVSDVKKDTPLFPVGPTGFGVRLLTRWAQRR